MVFALAGLSTITKFSCILCEYVCFNLGAKVQKLFITPYYIYSILFFLTEKESHRCRVVGFYSAEMSIFAIKKILL